MIFLNEQILQTPEKIQALIEAEKKYINYNIEAQQTLKEIILNYMQKFGTSTNSVNSDDVNTILKFLEDLKNSLMLCNDNIISLEKLLSEFTAITSSIITSVSFPESINKFNMEYSEIKLTIIKNTIQIEDCLYTISSFSDEKHLDLTNTHQNIQEESSVLSESPSEEILENLHNSNLRNNNSSESTSNIPELEISQGQYNSNSNNPMSAPYTKDFESLNAGNTQYVENTLIISETSGKVILPYTIAELQNLLQNSLDKYSTIDEIINKEYSLPIDLFKTPSISRFREAFKLVRNKEKKSIKSAFDLGMELLFNYNLHPAIITACKSLDELDIYLDYLETGETSKFDFFKIIFEIPPKVVKQKTL